MSSRIGGIIMRYCRSCQKLLSGLEAKKNKITFDLIITRQISAAIKSEKTLDNKFKKYIHKQILNDDTKFQDTLKVVSHNKNLKLNKNISELEEEVEEEEENIGPIFKDNIRNIWEASDDGCLQAVKFYYVQNTTYANKKNKNYHNWTPLHYASKKGHLEAVKFLLSQGAELDPIDLIGVTPCMLAAQHGHLEVLRVLSDKGANLNLQDKYGSTALHDAVWGNQTHVVQFLIQTGTVKSDLVSCDKLTPLALAKLYGNRTSIVNLLTFKKQE